MNENLLNQIRTAQNAYRTGTQAYQIAQQAVRFAHRIRNNQVENSRQNLRRRAPPRPMPVAYRANRVNRANLKYYRAVARKRKYARNRRRVKRRKKGVKMPKRRRYSRRRRKQSLKKRVRRLEIDNSAQMSNLLYKEISTDYIETDPNVATYTSYSITSKSQMAKPMAQLRYYNPSAPSTLITADAADLAETNKVMFRNIYAGITLKNNYRAPVKVTVYCLETKSDTNTGPNAQMDAAIADQVLQQGATTWNKANPNIYPTELTFFKQKWKVLDSCTKVLANGRSMTCRCNIPNFWYSPAYNDVNTNNFTTKYKSRVFYVRTQGVLGHEAAGVTDGADVGYIGGSLDVSQLIRYNVRYDAGGPSLNLIYVDNPAADTSTTANAVGVLNAQNVTNSGGFT